MSGTSRLDSTRQERKLEHAEGQGFLILSKGTSQFTNDAPEGGTNDRLAQVGALCPSPRGPASVVERR
jgi:hypothetical protein